MEDLFARMESDLKHAGLCDQTREHYLRNARWFSDHYACPPQTLGEREVRAWLMFLRQNEGCSTTSLQGHVVALKFLYGVTLKRPEVTAGILRPCEPGPVPAPLASRTLELLLEAVAPPVFRRVVTAAFGGGMQLHETCRLQVADIDSQKMVVRIRAANGKWDAFLPLDRSTLEVLREQWRETRPRSGLLFTTGPDRAPLASGRVEEALRDAARRAGFKDLTLGPTLRYSFLLRRLAQGAKVREVWHLLRHTSIRRLPVALGQGGRP